MRTTEEIKDIVESLGYGFIDEYMGEHHRRVIIKDTFGYKYDVSLNDLIIGKNPYFVGKSNPFTLENNIPLWLKINNKPFRLKEGNVYLGNNKKLFFSCNICPEDFDSDWAHIYSRGQGCPYCSGNRVSDQNRLSILYPEIASEWHPTKNGDLTPHNVPYASNKKAWWVCEDGHEWEASINNRTNMESGCPECASSKGEKEVLSFLKEFEISFIPEYRFEDCFYKRELPFDFAIFDSDGYLQCIIEYHGEQHYRPIKFFGGQKGYEERIRNDKIKADYCRDNNIPLKIIPYWEFENIEQILTETLSL